MTGHGEYSAASSRAGARDLSRARHGDARTEYSFRHALTQEAAYGTLLMRHRRNIHHRVAEGFEAGSADRLDDVAALLVHHYVEAGDDEATLRFALLAGETARRLYANSEAAAHYRTAIDAGLRLGADSEVLRSAFGEEGGSLEVAGRHHEAVAEYEEMRKIARERGDESMELDANMALALLYGTPRHCSTPRSDGSSPRRTPSWRGASVTGRPRRVRSGTSSFRTSTGTATTTARSTPARRRSRSRGSWTRASRSRSRSRTSRAPT